MIVLDTNVVSELIGPAPEPRVLHWFSSQVAEDLHVTSVTMGEILHGIELISPSRRRDVLRAGADKMFEKVFADRVLTFEDRGARSFSQIAAAAGEAYVPTRCADRRDRASPGSNAGHAEPIRVRRMRHEANQSVGGVNPLFPVSVTERSEGTEWPMADERAADFGKKERDSFGDFHWQG